MGCASCSNGKNGTPKGCGNKGHCTSGSCNKMNTFDWLAQMDIYDPEAFDVVEVSFKNGSRKDFFKNPSYTRAITGDMVVVEASNGYDVGRISLSGELVRLQMKKKKFHEDRILHKVIRRANDRDLEKLDEARGMEKKNMIRARAIARTLDLEMKIGDVEYQGDKRKATFYYTAEGRVDFRELVRLYAKEFRVKIEMRQIGSRQESAKVGGVGSCGRELCCSTWLSDFRTVTTSAARYQNIAINQTKLSGQCGRLKCCLNYELDTYMDALKEYPKNVDYLKTQKGSANLIKIDIFKSLMYYAYDTGRGKSPIVAITKERASIIKEMNKSGELPEDLVNVDEALSNELKSLDFADVTGEIELPDQKRKRRGKRRNSRRKNHPKGSHKKNNPRRDNRGNRNKDNKKKS